MKTRVLLTAILLLVFFPGTALAERLTFTSLPNPNVYPLFIIIDQSYLDADFIPARGGVAGLLALMKSGKADMTLLNRMPAQRMARDNGWQLTGATIVRAIHLLSYPPVNSRSDINKLKIISTFPGGSPDKVFQAGNFSVEPKFTDLYLAIQLFLKRDFDALLLPEPHISRVAGLLRERGATFSISDMQQLALGRDRVPINAGVVRPGFALEEINRAFVRAGDFIREHPDAATRIIAAGYAEHFRKPLPQTALLEALTSGRLEFGMAQDDEQ